jgi:hypothetical protein
VGISLADRSLSEISKNLMWLSGSENSISRNRMVMSVVLPSDTLPQQSRFVFTLVCMKCLLLEEVE